MAKSVYILGAGASREAGAPLMYDFLDKAEDIYQEDRDSQEDFRRVFKAISDLQVVHSKSYLDLYNIETLFGAFEMANLINKLVEYSPGDIAMLRSSLIKVIVKTLESTIKFPVSKDTVKVPAPYNVFMNLLDNDTDSSVITFNYDICMDFALHRLGHGVDYCLDGKSNGRYKLLKLHGSVNWARCANPSCNKIIPLDLSNFWTGTVLFPDTKSIKPIISPKLSTLKHDSCGNAGVLEVPVLVPPTWNKTEYHGDLTNVWRQAAIELSEAVNIYIIGYSLPETDAFFRYLFALGSIGEKRIKRFWVFDPDNSGEVKKRFEKLIGRGIDRRFEFFEEKFGTAIGIIRKEINETNSGH